jgi:photosystem II stability/assembly factor-like uncharacterized protein
MRTLVLLLFVLLLLPSLSHSQSLWQPQNSNIPPSEMVVTFSPVNDGICWACTMDTLNTAPSGYIRTTDGGDTWAYARIPGAGNGIIGQIAALDADTAYAAVYVLSPSNTAGVYKTTDGGSSWARQTVYGPSTSRYGPGAIRFFDVRNGVVVGTWPPETYATTDGGQHWIAVAMPPAYSTENQQSEMVFAGNCVWFTTAGAAVGARCFRSTNRGYTWFASVLESQYSNCWTCLAFQDSMKGICSTKKQEFLVPHSCRKTTDGGVTWTPLFDPILDNIAPTGICHIPGTGAAYLLAGGMNAGQRGLAISYDAGENWKLLDSTGALFLGFASDSTGWCSPRQHNSGVCKYAGPRLIDTSTSSVEGGIAAPASYLLAQNYPNPFNPSTTIRFELPTSSELRLSVYDMLGREVSVLVNERRDAGVHAVTFDASGFSSGVYFFRLQARDFTQTKRLLLLK